jgi:hypothetical protein
MGVASSHDRLNDDPSSTSTRVSSRTAELLTAARRGDVRRLRQLLPKLKSDKSAWAAAFLAACKVPTPLQASCVTRKANTNVNGINEIGWS